MNNYQRDSRGIARITVDRHALWKKVYCFDIWFKCLLFKLRNIRICIKQYMIHLLPAFGWKSVWRIYIHAVTFTFHFGEKNIQAFIDNISRSERSCVKFHLLQVLNNLPILTKWYLINDFYIETQKAHREREREREIARVWLEIIFMMTTSRGIM